MSVERRYDEDEVRRIFELATRETPDGPAPRSAADGLTIAEVREIGEEVGIDSGAVMRAAASLDGTRPATQSSTSLGMPVGVGRLVPIPRPMSDAEWERLVAELRSTFGARGRVTGHGTLREWSNGNLHACHEPSETGYRVRLGTRKGDASTLNALGVTGIVTGAIAFAATVASGGMAEALVVPWMIAGSGVAAIAANAVRLPQWAQRRARQMAQIEARIAAIVSAGEIPDGHASEAAAGTDGQTLGAGDPPAR
jgi:hypothetical protein